jgi:hypothetical protein
MSDERVSVPYEPPTVTFYGTVQELTLGTGAGQLDANIPACGPLAGQPAGPSGVVCKAFP